MFPDPADVQILLRESLVQQRIDILGEPYISNLAKAGRDKGLVDEETA